ncbi:MAG: tRNA uridine-5-carboxymethylaminomethyl(34) synthesis enzyme MnmG [Oscillospiraceae bacterium]|jgi:tRNA uridine 5-carboxymethylaminomethyl modification enzyme|nr:tRNA uridine-5-carboxymethylaminomethyl(34) synthesis enzyme MnmG [Oscillospiraceae bacterium]
MSNYFSYDVAVIGAGHAGIEASLAAARLGKKTAVFVMNLDSVGNCPCSPSIGGTAKGTLVREIDALGGEMAKATDACFLNSKILNTSKGAASRSLRAQIDRAKYKNYMKFRLETQENLYLRQAEIISLKKDEKWRITTRFGINYYSKCVVLACGTYLKGRIHIGEINYESGPDGIFPSLFLTESFQELKISTKRFKTGTPARILKSSIDFSKLEVQFGDEKVTPFSYDTDINKIGKNKEVCHIARTNKKTKEIILKNINKSPIYSGRIKSIGPRYCPSIEDKIVRFSDKENHQIFVEPCGLNTEEIYLHGMSSCLPEEVQIEFYHSILGFEDAVIMRPAYAIEYEIVDPISLKSTLEFKNLPGLFSAGQINGSSGYEEAASQGLIAGINAALKYSNKEQIVLSRSSSYIGTLIDDLVSKGVNDPYRALTSRAEYRLLLRLDNADERLTSIGRKAGLVSDNSWEKFNLRMEQKNIELKRIKKTFIKPNKKINEILQNKKIPLILENINIENLLKRPGINYEIIKKIDSKIPDIPDEIFQKVEIEVKYEGYIKKQNHHIKKLKELEFLPLPYETNYFKIPNLSLESQEKLAKIRPMNLSQAAGVSGVTPADISILMIWTKKQIGTINNKI